MPIFKKLSVRNATSQKRTCLKLFEAKEARPAYIKRFWRDWENPKKVRKKLLPGSFWERNVWALTPTIAVTVRRFRSAKEAR